MAESRAAHVYPANGCGVRPLPASNIQNRRFASRGSAHQPGSEHGCLLGRGT